MKQNILPQNEVLEKISYFYQKSLLVNKLYNKFLETKNTDDETVFKNKWIELFNEAHEFFAAKDWSEVDWPHRKSVILRAEINMSITIIETGERPFPPEIETLSFVKISYHVADNQDDYTETKAFPRFGLYLSLSLFNNIKKDSIAAIAIAKSEQGCNIVSPKLNAEQLKIIGREHAFLFQSKEDLESILRLCNDTLGLVNENLDEKGLVTNIID